MLGEPAHSARMTAYRLLLAALDDIGYKVHRLDFIPLLGCLAMCAQEDCKYVGPRISTL